LAEHGDDRNTLERHWRVIWRRKWVIVLTVFATTLAVIGGSYLITPVYEASATLHVKEPMPSVLGGDLVGAGLSAISTKEEINTQIEILKSRSLLEGVIAAEGLVDRYAVDRELGAEQRLQEALKKLRKDMSVSNIANTRLIRIAVRSEDAVLAGEITNSISRAFIERDLQSKSSEANAVLSFVSQQVEQVSQRLENAEEELLAYKQQYGIGVLDEETKLRVNLLAQLESSLQQVSVDRAVLGTRIAAVLDQIGLGAANHGALTDASRSPAVVRSQDRLTEAQVELARLEETSSTDSQRASELKAQIDSLEREIKEQIAASMGSAESTAVDATMQIQLAEYESKDVILAAQEGALRNLMAAHEAAINKLPAREINLVRLERARRINDDLYAALMKAKNEAQIEAASQLGNIDIVDPAVAPLDPVRPNRKDSLIVGLVVSLILGIGLAFLLEGLDYRVKSEEEVRKLLGGVPILGLIPRLEVRGNGRRGKGGNRERLTLITRDEPNSPISEAFKLLRANLHFLDLEQHHRTIVVTSPIPGDGKTTVAANLAIAFAAREERVLIVDADFRVPAIHRIFDLPESPGIAEVLLNGSDYRRVIQKIEGVENLDVLTTGTIPSSFSELLFSSRMKNLIRELKDGGYSRIIFDVAPLLVATETVDLASSEDATLLVVRMGEIDRRILMRTRQVFDNAKIGLLGSVLNRVDVKDRRYGYGYYYYYDGPEKRDRSI
jgi:succinoglycan biosynthesis transport protein ExoP